MKLLLLPLLVLTATFSKAQQFGGNPPSLKWKQVNTPAARVIFPAGMDSTALQVASIIKAVSNAVQPTIGQKKQQVSIVLQNQTTISNGYVGLAPFRSEFYLTPEQNSFELGSLSWPGQLAIHEYRHVQQYNNFNVGFSHVLKVVFGEGGQALGNAVTIPDWFFEGDAVYNETHVSEQGRGRLPFFFNGYRAIWAAGHNYSWMKLRNGSFRDFTPNHYPLGYMLTAYGREKYGDYFWKNITHDAASFKGGFYPLQKGIKKYSGEGYMQFRNNALGHFKKQFKTDANNTGISKQHFIADEEYPAYINDSTLVYLRSTYDHIPEFVLRTGKTERKIAIKDITTDDYFSYNNDKIVYAAYATDARWGYRNYNELVVMDVNSGRSKRITHKSKYFSPAFSKDGTRIVAVEVSPAGKSKLHVLDAQNGKIIAAIPNAGNLFYTHPQFYNDQILSAIRTPEGKMTLALIAINTGKTGYLLPLSFEPIGFPKIKGDTVYFTKTSSLDEQLCAYVIKSKILYKIGGGNNKDGIGRYQPAISDHQIAWTTFTAFGYQLREADMDSLQYQPISYASAFDALPDMGISSLRKDSAARLLGSVTPQPFQVTKYSKVHGLFNFHSLIPTINDPNYSLAIVGENVLNTFQSRLGLNYNRNEGYKRIGYDAVYGALFPYISAGADYTFHRRGIYKGTSIYYNETDLHAGLQVPLDLTKGKHLTALTFGTDVYYSQSRFQEVYRALFADRQYTYLNNYLIFSNHVQQARKNINPLFGQSFTITYRTAIAGSNASQLLGMGALYLPGLFTNHSLVISAAYQQNGQNNGIGFSNDFPFSKGYTAESLDHMTKAAANYHFPIAYPDAGFANLYYLMRLRGNFFYEDTYATANNFFTNGGRFSQHFRSTGAAVYFDGKLLNESAVSFGIRYSRLLDPDVFGGNGSNRIEFVLPVSIF